MALLRALALVVLLAADAAAGGVRAGDPAPDFTLQDWEGKALSLSSLRGKVVCLDFWASWCATCRTALPALDALARRHAGGALRVVAVDIDRDRAAADRFLAERLPRGPAVTLLHDPEATVLARYGAAGMPALYLVDRTGVVRLAEAGYDPSRLSEVERAIERLLEESPP